MSALKKIIVGHDLRAGGETAISSAIVLARKFDATLRLVHVVETDPLYQKISHPFASQRLEEIAQKAGVRLRDLGAGRELAQGRVLEADAVRQPAARQGDPAEPLVRGGGRPDRQRDPGLRPARAARA